MKATIEIPDALYRQVKARSALRGRSVRDVTIGLYRRWLAETPAPDRASDGDTPTDAVGAWLAGWEGLGEAVSTAALDARTTREILLTDRR